MIDSIFKMLMELINSQKLTASQLSARLEISTRSVYRYLDIMTLSGIPLTVTGGRNGGIMLGREFVLERNFFTSDELAIINSSIVNNGLDNKSISIMQKLSSIGNSINNIYEKTNIININSNNHQRHILAKISVINLAIQENHYLSINYHARDGMVTQRNIIPLNYLIKDGEWYIYCYCKLRDEYRTFKLTRISHLLQLDSCFDKLEQYPKLWNFMDSNYINLSFLVYPKSKFLVEDWLGVEAVKTMSDGSFRVDIDINNDNDLLYKLLSFGDGIKILSPQSILDNYHDMINSMKNIY